MSKAASHSPTPGPARGRGGGGGGAGGEPGWQHVLSLSKTFLIPIELVSTQEGNTCNTNLHQIFHK